MNVENINPPGLPRPPGFSHATVAAEHIYLAGQVGSDDTGAMVEPGDLVAQFTRAIRNVRVALEAAGGTPGGVVRLRYYVTDIAAYRAALPRIGEAYREVFGRHYPSTTLIGVNELFDPLALIEIEATAVR